MAIIIVNIWNSPHMTDLLSSCLKVYNYKFLNQDIIYV